MQKRGLSGVVVSVLIVLLSLAAVALVWSYLNGTLQGAGNTLTQTSVDTGKTVVKIVPGSEVYDILSGNLSFVVAAQDKVEGVTQSGFKINAKDSNGNKKGYDYNLSLNQLESKRIYFDLSNSSFGKFVSLEVTPIYTLSNGKKAYSTNTQVYAVRNNPPLKGSNFPDNFILNNSNLVAYYSFDDSTKPEKDYTGVNNGTSNGGSWNSTGKINGAYKFYGVGDYISVPDHPSLTMPNKVSLSLWIKMDAYGTYYATHLINKWTGTLDANYVLYLFGDYLGNGDNGKVCTYGNSGGTWRCLQSGWYSRILLNKWTHIAWTYDRDIGGQLYIDGLPFGGLGTGGVLASNNAPLRINSGGLNGLLDEVMIFNKTLTASEVYNLCKYQNNFASCG